MTDPKLKSYKLNIPTREEFHREFAGIITLADFDTTKPRHKHIPYTAAEAQFIHKIRLGKIKDKNYKII